MFQLSECARRCSPELLNEYLKNKRLALLPKGLKEKEKIGQAFIEIVNAVSLDKQAEIEVDFQIVQEMTGGAEIRLLSERARQESVNAPPDFENFTNYDTALWLYMNAEQLFMTAVTDCEIEDTKSWITYRVPLLEKAAVLKKPDVISEVVKSHYGRSGRARFCKTVKIEKNNFVGFAAYPLNYARSEEGYNDTGDLILKKNSAVFEVYFLYIPIEKENLGYLSVKVKDGGAKQVDAEILAQNFAKKVFDKDLTENDRVKYKLEKLENVDVTFNDFDDIDMIENVKVVSIVLCNPAFPANITLRASAKQGNFNMSDIAECLRRLNINSLRGFRIVNAQLRFQFKKERRDWKSKGVVSAKINANRNSSCNLGINDQHMTVRKYLRKWGIEGK